MRLHQRTHNHPPSKPSPTIETPTITYLANGISNWFKHTQATPQIKPSPKDRKTLQTWYEVQSINPATPSPSNLPRLKRNQRLSPQIAKHGSMDSIKGIPVKMAIWFLHQRMHIPRQGHSWFRGREDTWRTVCPARSRGGLRYRGSQYFF